MTALKVSLARYQYEQLLDTVNWLMSSRTLTVTDDSADVMSRPPQPLADIREEDTGVPTLKMDPHIRAKLFPGVTGAKKQEGPKKLQALKGKFIITLLKLKKSYYLYFSSLRSS